MENYDSKYIDQTISKMSTGNLDLNNWLDGGYERGVISLFYGPPASGKSNLVILAACHQAGKDKKIIFIDTEGSFSVDRVNQISKNISSFDIKNLIILKPDNFQEQKNSFINLLKELRESKNIGLIIVDSMTMLYRLELAQARKIGFDEVQNVNFDLAKQIKALHEIARKRNIPVLITAQVYNEFITEEEWLAGKESNVNLVGGDILKYWSKCIIELQNDKGKRKAIIRKHRSIPEKTLNFEIINEGIKKRGWL